MKKSYLVYEIDTEEVQERKTERILIECEKLTDVKKYFRYTKNDNSFRKLLRENKNIFTQNNIMYEIVKINF